MNPNLTGAAIMAPVIVLVIYRRVRRNFGKQPIRPRRTWARVGLFVVVTALVALSGLRDVRLLEGLAGGLMGGAVLGLLGLKLTTFQISGQRDCYTPNLWLGMALTALLVGRLAYRFLVIYPAMQAASQAAAAGASGSNLSGYVNSPLTMAIFGLLFGYYICYYAGILIHHRRVLAQLPAVAALESGG